MMHIVDVIPIARGIARDTLTYFSANPLSAGSLVRIPLRNRKVAGIVMGSRPVDTAKTDVKRSPYPLRKILEHRTSRILSEPFMCAIASTATHHAASQGAVLAHMLPGPLFEILPRLKKELTPLSSPLHKEKETSRKRHLIEILQVGSEERTTRYRGLVRESFAHGASVYIVVPTIREAIQFGEDLARGIEEYTLLLHSDLNKKGLLASTELIRTSSHPLLIIGTAGYLACERGDLGTLILEHENSSTYRTIARPVVDLRVFVEHYAKTRGVRLILGGFPLQVSTLWRHEVRELSELAPPLFRLLEGAPHAVIDMRANYKMPGIRFAIFSDEMKAMLSLTQEEGAHTFLFAARRGIAPLIICKDCGSTVTSSDGSTPMTLHKSPEGNVFIAHTTGEVRDAHECCKNCGSWNLHALGIGIERIEEELKNLFPHLTYFRVDHDRTPKSSDTQSMIRKFYDTPGSVLLGTERALSFLDTPLAYSGVVSIDALLSVPAWNINERIFALLLKIRDITTKGYLVQTRKADTRLIEHALKGNILEYYREEIHLREVLRYPPFSVLIKVSSYGGLARLEKTMTSLTSKLEALNAEIYPIPISIGKNRYAGYLFIRVPRKTWPDPRLIEVLGNLPPECAVEIDPYRLV